MIKKCLRVLIPIFVVILSISFLDNCDSCKRARQAEARRIVNVSAEKKEFQEAMATCERIKAEIEKHHEIYKESLNRFGSILNEDQEQIAAKQILIKAEELLNFTDKCLKNETVIKRVSNAENQYLDYKNY